MTHFFKSWKTSKSIFLTAFIRFLFIENSRKSANYFLKWYVFYSHKIWFYLFVSMYECISLKRFSTGERERCISCFVKTICAGNIFPEMRVKRRISISIYILHKSRDIILSSSLRCNARKENDLQRIRETRLYIYIDPFEFGWLKVKDFNLLRACNSLQRSISGN